MTAPRRRVRSVRTRFDDPLFRVSMHFGRFVGREGMALA